MTRRNAILCLLVVLLSAVAWWRGRGEDGPPSATPLTDVPESPAVVEPVRTLENDPAAAQPRVDPPTEERAEPVSVEVLVIDEGGSPRAGAEVRAIDRGFAHREWKRAEEMYLARAETDEGGRATLLLPSDRQTRLHASGGGASVTTRHFWPTWEPKHELRLGPSGTVGGCVETREGDPIDDAVVVGFFESKHGFLSASATSDLDGRFAFEGIPEDDLVRDYLYLYASKAGFWKSGSIQCSMEQARAEEVVLELKRQAKLTGRCLSPEGEPIDRVRVRCEISDPGHQSSAWTGADGRFTLLTVPGPGRLLAVADGYAPTLLEGIRADRDPSDLGDLRLREGGVVSGLATGVDGKPFAGASVVLISTPPMPHAQRTTTDERGRFEFRHVGEGDHVLSVSGMGNPRGGLRPIEEVATEVRAGDPPYTFRLTGGRYLQVRLVPPGRGETVTLSNVVVEFIRGGAMGGCKVRQWSPGQACRWRLEPGRFLVRVTAPGYEPAELEAIVRDDAEVIVEIPLRPSPR